jgi:hypothetical protein
MKRMLTILPLALVLLAAVDCSRKSVAPAAAGQEEPATQDPTHLPLKDLRGLRFLVVPEPRAEGAMARAEAEAATLALEARGVDPRTAGPPSP